MKLTNNCIIPLRIQNISLGCNLNYNPKPICTTFLGVNFNGRVQADEFKPSDE